MNIPLVDIHDGIRCTRGPATGPTIATSAASDRRGPTTAVWKEFRYNVLHAQRRDDELFVR